MSTRPAAVHPLAPRFAQGITGLLCLEAIMFGTPAAVVVAFALVAVALFAPRFSPVGWVLAGMVAALALLSATTGICVGCEIYRLFLARRTSHGDEDPRALMALDGQGPWLVVLTAPGCARCEPTARELEAVAGGREVRRVDITRTPGATKLPVRSVPAAIAVAADGALRVVKTGRLDRASLAEVAAAV